MALLGSGNRSRTSGKANLVLFLEVLVRTRGVLYVHSVMPAVTPHVEWAVASVIGEAVRLDWLPQPALPSLLYAEATWLGESGTAGRLVSNLRGWPIRFEATEDRSATNDGERFAFTPSLGLFHAMTAANGDVVVPENRLRQVLESGTDVATAIGRLLGEPWDRELESFRQAGDGAPVRWLHQVG